MAPSHEDKIKSLKAKREAFRIELQELKDVLNDPEVFSHSRDIPHREINLRLEDLQNEYATFAKSQPELDTADETGDLLRERMKLKSFYTQVRAQALDLLPNNNIANTAAHTIHDDAQNHASPYSQIEPMDIDVHLPKLNLPTFSGHYEEWPGFADQFRSAVHENQRINECKKLMYLRSCLKNEALKSIESLSNSTSNYAVAWSILEKRYHQPAIIVTSHLKALFETPVVYRSTHRELRPFLNTIEAHYRSLQVLNQPTTDSLLIYLLLSKVDKETNLKWKEHTRHEQFPSIETFFTFLHERCQILEPFGNTNNFPTAPAPNHTQRQQPLRRPPPRPLFSNTQNYPSQVLNIQSPTVSCNFCKGPHYPQQCETFLRLAIPDRIKFAKTKNSCLNCLRSTHRTSECRSTTCRRCYQRHHTLLHLDVAPTSTATTPSQVNATCLKLNSPSQILLSTAIINIIDKFGQPHPCRVLLDSCSQSHFITKRFIRTLQLPTKSASIPINGMNEMSSLIHSQTTAQIKSRNNNFSRNLSMLVVGEISQRLPVCQIDKYSLNIPKNIYLADPRFHEPADIDGLLGAQVFWDLLCEGQIALNEGSMKLQRTHLGWIVTGEAPIKLNRNSTICNLSTEALSNKISQFWELEERVAERLLSVKAIIRKCIRCCRARPTIPEYPMGDLPKNRVTLKRPFLATGIDYCGPFFIKEKKLRNTKTVKCNVAISICLATKAVHIELVSDLTTDAFLAALRRFFARRGKSADLYSDNATNFVGANRNLHDLHELLQSENHNNYIKQHLANDNINWHFIPPRAPHFGGLWEAAVKSFKNHLVRVLGNTILTYEAFTTCITETEAILNSRPITPLSSDPTDYTALTPGHFLIGETITNLPERDFSAVDASRLTLCQHIQQMKQHFWTRWRKEYLNQLTVRQKWHQSTEADIQEGSLVILKEDNLPPLCWPLGRLIKKHPGADGITRVVTIRTSNGTYKRPIKRVAPLPINI